MAPIVEYEGEQLEIDFALPQFSLCPSCASLVIAIADGCGVCGWSDAEKLLGDKPKSPKSGKSPLSIPCLIHRPKQPQLKGVIRKDLGDSFVVYIPSDDSTVTVPKLLVYPDFSGGVGQIDKSPRKNLTPSTNSPRKKRRQNGLGNGSIYYRQVSKNGKQYTDAYYHYVEDGKKRTKYIPKKLLDRVKEAEYLKLPVSDILVLLGGDKKNPRKSFDTLSTEVDEKLNDGCIEQVLETSVKNPRKTKTPSKRRKQGYGGGYIECKPIKRGGKEYKQYWYHYEEWREGDRITKKSQYIPKKMENKIIRMNNEKAPVAEILKFLKSKGKRKK